MGKVKEEKKFHFDGGNVYVLLDVCDDEGYGVELISENGLRGNLVGLGSFSFGHGDKGFEDSLKVFDFFIDSLNDMNSEESKLNEFLKSLDQFYCIYDENDLKSFKEGRDELMTWVNK